MAERRKVRSGTSGRASTRGRGPSDLDEPELLDEEPAPDEDELLDLDEPDETEDEIFDADEPEAADEDEASGNGQRLGRRRPARRSGSTMTAAQAAQAALREIAQLTEKQPEGVTGVERAEDGWTVGIELVEDQRIPSSADILATYEATIDGGGELVSYRRVRRYARGRGDTEDV
jgi:Gas vesicle synthesis protein GvpO